MVVDMRNQIDWLNFKKSLAVIVKRCAIYAGNRGHNFFGIKYYAQCFTASNVDLTTETPATNKFCDDYNVGNDNVVYVFKIIT